MYMLAYISAMAYMLFLLVLFGNRRKGYALLFASLGFGVVGFMMTPNPNLFVDTVRFFETLDTTRMYLDWNPTAGWRYLMDASGYNSTPVMGLIMYVLAFLPQNGWLTFLVSFLDIGAGLFIIYEQSRRGKTFSPVVLAALIFVCLFNFNASVTGVRNTMAVFVSVGIVYYFSTVRKRVLLPVLLCIPLILIHPFALFVPVFYILGITYKKCNTLFIVFCIIALLQRRFQDIAFSWVDRFSSIPFFGSLSFKSDQYFGDGAYIGASSDFGTTRSLLMLIFYIAILCTTFLVKSTLSHRYLGFSILMVCFAVGSFGDATLFSRCSTAMLIVILSALYDLISSLLNLGQRYRWSYVLLAMIGVFSLIVLADNLRAGNKFELIVPNYTSLILIICIFMSTVFLYMLPLREKQLQNYEYRTVNGAVR